MQNRLLYRMSEKNKGALPSGALERPFGPIFSSAPDGSAPYFCALLQNFELYPFESTPGHPIQGYRNNHKNTLSTGESHNFVTPVYLDRNCT